MTHPTYTEADFNRIGWHDCHIWGIELRVGDPVRGDWISELAIDIDFILEGSCGVDGGRFFVAPASLVFHHVTDLRIHIDWGSSGFQCALHHVSIDGVEREEVGDQKICFDQVYYSWRIRLNWPEGEISFGATGFTQRLRADPVWITERHLPRLLRNPGHGEH